MQSFLTRLFLNAVKREALRRGIAPEDISAERGTGNPATGNEAFQIVTNAGYLAVAVFGAGVGIFAWSMVFLVVNLIKLLVTP